MSTYGHIADYLALGSARMVGWALRNLTPDQNIPAHRVVNRKGELSGRHHFRPPEKMQRLLEGEGVKVEDNRVLAFKKLLWIPAQEILGEEPDLDPY